MAIMLNKGWEFWLALAVSTGLVGWIAKQLFEKAVGKWRAGVGWIATVNAAIAELNGFKSKWAVAFDPTSPEGITAGFNAINGKIDALAGLVAKVADVSATKVAVVHGILTSLLNRYDDPVVNFCADLKLVFANRAAMRIMGATSFDELREHNWKDKFEFVQLDQAEAAMQKAKKEHRPCTINLILRGTRTNGKSIQFVLEPVTSPEDHGFTGFTGAVLDLEMRHDRAKTPH